MQHYFDQLKTDVLAFFFFNDCDFQVFMYIFCCRACTLTYTG